MIKRLICIISVIDKIRDQKNIPHRDGGFSLTLKTTNMKISTT